MFAGAMYFPNPWWSTSECTENMRPEDCEFLSGIPNNCKGSSRNGENGKSADCSQSAGLRDWFTNYTKVAKRTIKRKFLTGEYINNSKARNDCRIQTSIQSLFCGTRQSDQLLSKLLQLCLQLICDPKLRLGFIHGIPQDQQKLLVMAVV